MTDDLIAAPGSYTVTLTVTDSQGITASDSCTVHVIGLGIAIKDADDRFGYALVNNDDDDEDGTPDCDQGDAVGNEIANEDNLIEVQLSVEPDTLPGQVKFCNISSSPHQGSIKVWSDSNKNNLIIPDEYPRSVMYPPDQLPAKAYVEAIGNGGYQVGRLRLKYITPDDETINTYPYAEVLFTVDELKVYWDDSQEPACSKLVDWPEYAGRPRSPRYMFGQDDPIYVQVRFYGTDPSWPESISGFVKVTSDTHADFVRLNLKETSDGSQTFKNSAADNELLYLAAETCDHATDNDKIEVVDEDILTFWAETRPGLRDYRSCKKVMVDRAEIRTECQRSYPYHCTCDPPSSFIPTNRFAWGLYDNIGGDPGLVWWKNFKRTDLESRPEHWLASTDSEYADSVDLVSWSGHSWGSENMHFFTESGCVNVSWEETNLGDTDADWVVFDRCWSLRADLDTLMMKLLNDERCPHIFCGFYSGNYWYSDVEHGKVFADRLREYTIKQAWFDYCRDTQPIGHVVRVFAPETHMWESLTGSGPKEVGQDPVFMDPWYWTYEDYTKRK